MFSYISEKVTWRFFFRRCPKKVINQRVIRHFQGQRGQGNYPQPNLWKSCGISAGFAESSRNHPLEISTNGGMCSLWIRWISRKYRVLQDFLQLHCEKNRDFLGKQAGIPLQELEYTESEGIPWLERNRRVHSAVEKQDGYPQRYPCGQTLAKSSRKGVIHSIHIPYYDCGNIIPCILSWEGFAPCNLLPMFSCCWTA